MEAGDLNASSSSSAAPPNPNDGVESPNYYPTPTPRLPTVGEVLERGLQRESGVEPTEMELKSHTKAAMDRCAVLARGALEHGRGIYCVTVAPTGEAIGPGTWIQPNGTRLDGVYEGHCLAEVKRAVLSTPWPDVFVKGNIHDGMLQGEVEVALPNVGRFVGTVIDGRAHGTGVWVRDNGSWFEGNWTNGERSGRGTEHYNDVSFYSGQWSSDLYHGNGELVVDGISKFDGTWSEGVRVGRGVVTEVTTAPVRFEVEYNESGAEMQRVSAEQAEICRLKEKVEELERAVPSEAGEGDEEAPPPPLSPPLAPRDTTSPAEPGGGAGGATVCKVCFSSPITRVLRPCAHACLCASCETKIRSAEMRDSHGSLHSRLGRFRCPICRSICRAVDEIILA